ncbi:WD40 repeat-like protein [Vararia minispora EC-137]|uniref:WD40 repeat-like protein n=1 Tax=Vararia minispora EC-137 TaxID=1314806 RepID=A0ACB8QUX0_9AGAM|nr:WD40 repeat-like protein [Vararia minispora EC-137]
MKPTVVDEDEVEDDEEENKLINEEYKTWKKNAPYLYDLVITHALDWPTLTCQWFPDKEQPANKPYTTHRILLGTHTSGQAPDYLQIATVQIPKRSGPGAETLDARAYDDGSGELGGHTLPAAQPRIQVVQRINHAGEVNRARYMPQNPDLLATKAVSGEVLVFDRTRHPSEPERGGVCKPDIRLIGQTREGFGLAWNPNKKGHIIAASEDKTVCHWDVNSYSKGEPMLQPVNVFSEHTAVVGDVDWHATDENVFASVGDDKMLKIWDLRTKTATSSIQAHDQEILSVAFALSPDHAHLILTGSADKSVHMRDIRNLDRPLHVFESHADEVLHLAWSPHHPSIFASGAGDRRINVWDISKCGIEQSPDDQEDGPPELMFIHGGHTARPTDFCWAPGIDEHWTIASTSEDNVVMVWQPTMHVWAGEDMKVAAEQLEAIEPMEGVESAGAGTVGRSGTQSMSMSRSESVEAMEES